MGSFEQEKHLKPLVAGIVVLVLIFGIWTYSSYRQTLARLDRKIVATEKDMAQFNDYLQEFRELQSSLQKLKPRQTTGARKNLISTVEAATDQIAARNQLIYMRPQPDKSRDGLTEEGVEIKLEKLRLSQLVELLYRFDRVVPPLRVSQLRLRTRFENPEQLDAAMLLSRFSEKR